MQYVAIEFDLSDKVEMAIGKYNPVFVINNNSNKSPYIWKRNSNYSWDGFDIDEYLKKEQF